MHKVLPWLVRWALCARIRDFCPALADLYFFPHCTLFQFICAFRPASWAGSRAPVFSELQFLSHRLL
jgi:hypothetical protein